MIDYDGRRFSPAGHHAEGNDVTVASYRQRGDLLWADFSGGRVRRGALTGVCRPDDTLEFSYTMVLADGALVAGHCESTPELLPDGRIRLHERWERYGPQAATGVSELDEIAPG
ncbi:hypothetical protein EV649_4311 [Kribbella sp. VKM Ac-2569]|uniref:hypothetical protein n=1 Tax=Kribbella sp. VKM Ac-2569 TaxID=2512220 RepID=UPI00102AF511|nr:hypothetical protein [Kribbella sp. VKM Ac-2569]RZT16778.1 hypothetical protein EV649_4311 [Kribbella sp. VKM Ac-2569]